MVGFLNRDIMFITHNLLTQKKSTRIRWENHQAILDGLGEDQISGNGAEGDFAEGEMTIRGNV